MDYVPLSHLVRKDFQLGSNPDPNLASGPVSFTTCDIALQYVQFILASIGEVFFFLSNSTILLIECVASKNKETKIASSEHSAA